MGLNLCIFVCRWKYQRAKIWLKDQGNQYKSLSANLLHGREERAQRTINCGAAEIISAS
jgi:hypothetical protein